MKIELAQMADGIILITGLIILVIVFVGANWLVARASILKRNIPPEEIQLITAIKTKLSEVVYITDDSEFATLILMLDAFLKEFYPSSGIVRPFETWMVLARRYYNKMRVMPIAGLDASEEVISILQDVLCLASKLQSNEVFPIRGHIWLSCLMRILQLDSLS